MKKLMTIVLGMMVAVGMAGMAIAGSIDSPGPPSSGSGMYTLQQVYNYLSAGTTATIPGSFQEPSAGPGSTMKTTKQIYEAVATPFPQCDATAADVKTGKKFFCTVAGNWGVKTGTMSPYTNVLRTGQTSTFYTGDDGYYSSTRGRAPSYSWVVNPSTVLDNVTGLMWAARGDGAGCATRASMVWTAALGWAEALSFDGYTDWRLPNVREYQSLLRPGRGLDGTYFYEHPGTPWTSTSFTGWNGLVWIVGEDAGTLAYTTADLNRNLRVRAVRGGQ